MDASNLLKPVLSKSEISCVNDNISRIPTAFRKDRGLNRRFQRIDITEPNAADTLYLKGIQSKYESFHGVHYTEAANKVCIDLSQKYISFGKFQIKPLTRWEALQS